MALHSDAGIGATLNYLAGTTDFGDAAALRKIAALVGAMTGDGSPEGVVSATVGALYVDETAPALFQKTSGSGSTGWSEITSGVPRRNLLTNGSFAVWQRGTSMAAAQWAADRWYAHRTSSATEVTISSVTDAETKALGFGQAIRIQRNAGATSTTFVGLSQALETRDSWQLAGKTVTLSYWARRGADYSDATQNVLALIYYGTGTDEATTAITTWTGVGNIQANSPSLTTSWQRYTMTGTLGAVSQVGVRLSIGGFTGTAGAADYADIAGVQLEVGPTASPFEHKSYAQHLRECQRYNVRVTAAAAGDRFGMGHNTTTVTAQVLVNFPVTMRTSPTAISQSGAAGDYSIGYANTSTVCSAVPSFVAASPSNGVVLFTVASGLTTGQGCTGRAVNTSAYLGFSADL